MKTPDWFDHLSLAGSEGTISAFVALALRTEALARRWVLESTRAQRVDLAGTIDPAAAEDADWIAECEWFVANVGNVDIVLRNRRRRWTFLVEHKIATRLSTGQITKYDAAVRATREHIHPNEIVVSCLLTPSGNPHEVDKAHDGPGTTSAVQLGCQGLTGEPGQPSPLDRMEADAVYARCLSEMRRLAAQAQSADAPDTTNARKNLLARIAALLQVPARSGLELEANGWTIRVPLGARQCVSLTEPEQPGRPVVRRSVIWPEPGLGAPWSEECLRHPDADALLDEQARLVVHAIKSGPRREG